MPSYKDEPAKGEIQKAAIGISTSFNVTVKALQDLPESNVCPTSYMAF